MLSHDRIPYTHQLLMTHTCMATGWMGVCWSNDIRIHAWQRGRVCLCLTNDNIVGEHMSGKVSALLMRYCTNRWAGKTGLSGWVRGGLIEHDLCTK